MTIKVSGTRGFKERCHRSCLDSLSKLSFNIVALKLRFDTANPSHALSSRL
ncbi:hypothetical protein VCR1J2_200400 [Vibrio coralliirubri]|nr:hypothetical protein VCR1J2_200400 [Vibrio coralliirubri]